MATTTSAPRRRRRRRVAIIAITAAVGIGGITAAAYFLTRGTSTLSVPAPVAGTPPPVAFTLSATNPSGAMSPGDADSFDLNATNPTATPLIFQLAATVKKDVNGGVYDTVAHAFNDNCLATWFTTAYSSPGMTFTLAANATNVSLEQVVISMIDSGTDQSACESLAIEVDVSAS
jgi:hypothetical protein